MPRTVLYETLASSGARMGEYRGAQTAAAYGDPADEFAALRSGFAIYDLGWRAKLLVTGPDRVRWLNGMVTNNIKDLPENRGSYNFLLNAQGRIQGDMYIYDRGEYFLIDTDLSQSEKITDIFDKFIIMDDVEISDAGDKLTAIGLCCGPCRELFFQSGLPSDLQDLEVRDLEWKGIGISLVRMPAGHGFEIWLAPQNATFVWKQLIALAVTPVGTDAVELFRIASGIPRYGQDIRERDLPQETAQTQALDFQKGCYVGQEIVERIHSRGNVHRAFTGFRFEGEPPAAGSKIHSGDKEVGEITSAAALPSKNAGPHPVGLGYLRREAGISHADLRAGETRVTVASPPFNEL